MMEGLAPDDLLAERRIQGWDVTALRAILDSVPHSTSHTHQIIMLSRAQLGTAYRFEWSPRTSQQGAAE